MSGPGAYPQAMGGSTALEGTQNLADILERILDKGIVIAGDIQVNLLDIELLTIKLRLLVASVDKAKEMGIDWWEHDPALSRAAQGGEALEERVRRLEESTGLAELDGRTNGRDQAEGRNLEREA